MADLLTDADIETFTDSTEWSREEDALVRTIVASTFPDAIDQVRRVADEAESADHHPDIDIRYTAVTYRLSTHSAGGITRKDVLLAEAIDRIAR